MGQQQMQTCCFDNFAPGLFWTFQSVILDSRTAKARDHRDTHEPPVI